MAHSGGLFFMAVGAIIAAFTPSLNKTGISASGISQIFDRGLDLCFAP